MCVLSEEREERELLDCVVCGHLKSWTKLANKSRIIFSDRVLNQGVSPASWGKEKEDEGES